MDYEKQIFFLQKFKSIVGIRTSEVNYSERVKRRMRNKIKECDHFSLAVTGTEK